MELWILFNANLFCVGMLSMEVIQLRVLTRKLHCGSLRALLTGKAPNTLGSMSKSYASSWSWNCLRLIQIIYMFSVSVRCWTFLFKSLVPWLAFQALFMSQFDKLNPRPVLLLPCWLLMFFPMSHFWGCRCNYIIIFHPHLYR